MLDLLGAQHYASYVWNEEQRRFDGGVRINMDAANLEQYERYYQYHDPITLTLQQFHRAVRVTDVMPQSHLKRTEFFNDFLARDGLYWGVNLYAWSGDHNIGDMRIWRDKRRENFSLDDLGLLDLVRPALVAALQRSHNKKDSPDLVTSACNLELQTLLSLREREIAQLVARGLSDKDIARHLNISLATVRTHVDHAFHKLNVNNRMKLVHKLNL